MAEVLDLSLLKRRVEELENRGHEIGDQLKSADGDGTSGGMEARVAALEAHMEHVRTDLSVLRQDVGTLKTDMAAVKERLLHVANKADVYTIVTAVGLMLGALTVLAPVLQRLLGVK